MKNLGINFYHFLPTHLSTILLRKHGPISKSISKRYCQVVVLFSRLFCLVLVSIDYIYGKATLTQFEEIFEEYENLMGASNDGSRLASSLGNSIVKRRKSWILRICCNQSRHSQSLLDISISLRDV